ncbi:hypothetical protein WCQ02_41330 [Paraburkholderia tropica]|uniref:hypothetical protein n=1 Tax=Paraburkholderia tropica TaxID=92647 RepID=UPI003019CEAA
MSKLIEGLRLNIRKLKADGDDGFEGLMAAVLTELTRRSFAIASSGSQRGRDGQSVLDRGVVLFEAKRYDDALPKERILTKITEIAGDTDSTPELFIVGSTSPISAQYISIMQSAARRFGMVVMALSWPDTGLAELAVFVAMAPDVSAEFIARHAAVSPSELSEQLDAVRAHSQFQARSEELQTIVLQPSIAPAFALPDNAAWLEKVFSDASHARKVLGQPLSPADTSVVGTLDRADLRVRLSNAVFSKLDDAVIAILGADGNGKSWIFAQAWCHHPVRPLTVVVVPDDVGLQVSPEICLELLVSKLVAQTSDVPRAETRERWLRHFERWRTNRDIPQPRLVVFVDGVNQRETVDWVRFLDAMSEVVTQLGGRLVFSCRRLFYRSRLENGLVSRVESIDVPEWSDPELDELLKARGTSIAALDAGIVRSLRNPRIFGVAMSLFNKEEIKAFGELSVSRLLFEHIRSGNATLDSSMEPSRFAAEICSHADDIVQRLENNEPDGLIEFEMSSFGASGNSAKAISDRFVITSAGHFFEMIDGEPNRYVLKEEGLPLAMGLALVSKVRTALRRRKSVEEALSNILDPIAALDRTSDILLGAILSAVIQDCPKEVVTPLVRSFVSLQNIDAGHFAEFRNLFGRDPVAFFGAVESLVLSRDVASNFSWLTAAANDLAGAAKFESAHVASIHRWLSMYSLAPERMVLIPNTLEHADEHEQKLKERQQELATSLESMSKDERDLLGEMVLQDHGDYSQLGRIALQALASRPLALYANSLAKWCFASALNGGYRDNRDDFYSLLRFNVLDWASMRDALLDVANFLRQTGTSSIGQWALVYVLQATGNSDDAREASHIAQKLTKDNERMRNWRLLEDYCATDPCDPASEEPENIDNTGINYGAINPAELRRIPSRSRDDHFFTNAQPGLARFLPEVAVGVLRSFAAEATSREQQEFTYAVSFLVEQTVALDEHIAAAYIEKGRTLAQAALDAGEDKHNGAWVAAQFALCVAFPHMTGDEQLDALLCHPDDKTVMVDLGFLLRPVGSIKIERALEKAIHDGNFVRQFRMLLFAEYSRTPLTALTKEMVVKLLSSEHDHVRLSALSLIRASADPALLTALVNTGWNAGSLDAVSRKIEIMHGSLALVLAADQGCITIESCLDRIDFSAFELLAEKLGAEASVAIAERLGIAIWKTSKYRVIGNLPDIEQNLQGRHWPVIYEVSQKASQDEIPGEQLLQSADIGDAWYERQEKNRKVAERFERDLTNAGAQLVIRPVTVELIAAIDRADTSFLDAWAKLFLELSGQALCNLHNIGMVAAEVIARRDAVVGQNLFEHFRTSTPQVRVTFGHAKVDIDAATAWGAADNSEMKERCFARLDRISNDHELAMEVIAAVRAQRSDALRDYVLDRRQRIEPALRARAAMVAGLSPDKPWAIETVELLKDEFGFLNGAYRAARYAMERHQWSRHWAARMRIATDPIELWRYTVLLSRIVDGRFDGAELAGDSPSALIQRFGPTLNSAIRHRIGKWKNKRSSKLFGMNAPDRIFTTRNKNCLP